VELRKNGLSLDKERLEAQPDSDLRLSRYWRKRQKIQETRSNTTVWASRFGVAVLLANIHESE